MKQPLQRNDHNEIHNHKFILGVWFLCKRSCGYMCVCAQTKPQGNKAVALLPCCPVTYPLFGFSFQFPFTLHRMSINEGISDAFEKLLPIFSGGLTQCSHSRCPCSPSLLLARYVFLLHLNSVNTNGCYWWIWKHGFLWVITVLHHKWI